MEVMQSETMRRLRLQDMDLTENTACRLPVCVCVDASYSMRRENRMIQVNEGLREFIRSISANPCACDSVEMCIVSFGDNDARVVAPFQSTTKLHFDDIVPSGKTPIGKAVTASIEELRKRQQLYKERGISSYHPWLILISDGEGTDDFRAAARELIQLQQQKRVKVLCIGIGDEQNDLRHFQLNGDVIQLEKFQLGNFFTWISKSMSSMSTQSPEEDLELPGFPLSMRK